MIPFDSRYYFDDNSSIISPRDGPCHMSQHRLCNMFLLHVFFLLSWWLCSRQAPLSCACVAARRGFHGALALRHGIILWAIWHMMYCAVSCIYRSPSVNPKCWLRFSADLTMLCPLFLVLHSIFFSFVGWSQVCNVCFLHLKCSVQRDEMKWSKYLKSLLSFLLSHNAAACLTTHIIKQASYWQSWLIKETEKKLIKFVKFVLVYTWNDCFSLGASKREFLGTELAVLC